MTIDNETLATYNHSARELAEFFEGIGARTKDVEYALRLAGKEDGSARVLELGCGNGRDAAEIIPRSLTYTGIDYSEVFIEMARQSISSADFQVADMAEYEYGEDSYDVIFAFASLLHLDITDLQQVIRKSVRALSSGGVFYISTKTKPGCLSEIQNDQFGTRVFYYYDLDTIADVLPSELDIAFADLVQKGNTSWLEVALRKV